MKETDDQLTRKEEFYLPLLALQTPEHNGANSTEQVNSAKRCLTSGNKSNHMH